MSLIYLIEKSHFIAFGIYHKVLILQKEEHALFYYFARSLRVLVFKKKPSTKLRLSTRNFFSVRYPREYIM